MGGCEDLDKVSMIIQDEVCPFCRNEGRWESFRWLSPAMLEALCDCGNCTHFIFEAVRQ